jgi:hypothetical protein
VAAQVLHCARTPMKCFDRRPRAIRRCLSLAGMGLLAFALFGCVTTTYQPLVSLQRPIVVDPHVANFEGLRMLVRCVPGEALAPSDAELLCRRLRSLFQNQGAEVEVDVPRGGVSARAEEAGSKPHLIVDLKARALHEQDSKLLWILSALTLTLVPAVTEYTFAQDVTIRDTEGFVLATDSLQGRFVRYFGFGVWAVNGALDLVVRSEPEQLTGDGAQKEFSRDFYGQLSQLAFNAHMRSVVLRGFADEPKGGPK